MKKLFLLIFFSLFSINLLHAVEQSFLQDVDIHGDLRTKWKSSWGASEDHSFKAEATMGCDYIKPEAWVSVKIKAATSNGKESLIFLDKAFLGYQIYESDKIGFSLEIGRNKMDSMFDSKMQFDSYFNGAHLVYTFKEPGLIDFMLHGGPHIVDSSKNHYGWIAEGIWNKVADTSITVKYSYTDWNAPTEKKKKIFAKEYYYALSQITASYDIGDTTVYGAYLFNHQEERYNDGFYVGFTIGKIRKVHDFLFDVNFQATKANLLCPRDNKALKKGVQAKIVYALAQSLNVEAKFSRHDDNNNNKLEMQAVYMW